MITIFGRTLNFVGDGNPKAEKGFWYNIIQSNDDQTKFDIHLPGQTASLIDCVGVLTSVVTSADCFATEDCSLHVGDHVMVSIKDRTINKLSKSQFDALVSVDKM